MSPIPIISLIGIALIILVVRLMRKDIKSFPSNWDNLLRSHVHYYRQLSTEEQKRFQSRMMIFLSEVNIEGVEIEIESLDKVLIAASAVIPVFGFKEWHYNNLDYVLLYPEYFGTNYEYIKDKEKQAQFDREVVCSAKTRKGKGPRCKNRTENKSGKCYAHQ